MIDFKQYDVFDIALALYHWLQHNWEGQDEDLYKDFCTLTNPGMYKPSISEQNYDNISEEAIEIYNELTKDNYKQILNLVLEYKPKN